MRRAVVAFLLVATAVHARAQDAGWKAGVAKVVITPSQPMWMSGYGNRNKPAEGQVHDLWAKALVIEAPQRRSVLVTMDLVGIDRELSQSVCAELEKRHSLARADIMLSVSHTHCGPVVGTNLRSMYPLDEQQNQLVDNYTRELKSKLVNVVAEAIRNVEPVEIAHGDGFATFATNRRNNKEPDVPNLRALGRLKGPVFHEVPVLALRRPDGKLQAVVFGYACHATVLSFYQWCGDYPGFAQLALEKAHPGATALFFAGCGADQNPLPRRTVALAEQYGQKLADEVDAVLNAPMTPVTAELRTSYTEIDLPFAELPTRDTLVEQTRSKNPYEVGRAKTLLRRLEQGERLRQTYPYPVQAWRLGRDLTWTALGGEVVVDYVLRLRQELGPLWVAGYSNDVMAYIPSLRVLKEGGYEGASSMIVYGQPTVWGPRIEELIVTALHEQVGKVRGK